LRERLQQIAAGFAAHAAHAQRGSSSEPGDAPEPPISRSHSAGSGS
jgi:hypothetical protein